MGQSDDPDAVSLDAMRVFARVAERGSFSAAARDLAMPKQTVSRWVAGLEQSLGVQLLHRTTRRSRLTDAGREYAERCREIARLATEANQSVGADQDLRGILRVTADPLFGEAFLAPLLLRLRTLHPLLSVEVTLLQRQVDLIEEGFDVAFRVGELADSTLIARKLGPAHMTYVASPGYLSRSGVPCSPAELNAHTLVVLAPEGRPVRWAFQDAGQSVSWHPVDGQLRVNHLGLARSAAVAGLGVANLPAFACRTQLESGELKLVLEQYTPPFGAISVVYPGHRVRAQRVRAFVEIAVVHFGEQSGGLG